MPKAAFDFLYLASQSPRRRQLLGQMGVRHELLLPGADEDAEALEAVRGNEAPKAYVQRVTWAKLHAAQRRLQSRLQSGGLPAAPILCADTTVALGRLILGKPADAQDAARMLALLSGRTHRVLTAVAMAHGRRERLLLCESTVQFAPLSRAQIEAYVRSGEPMGKAGAYAIQSAAAGWIPSIRGSYSGIMGLPLFETAQLLRDFKVRSEA